MSVSGCILVLQKADATTPRVPRITRTRSIGMAKISWAAHEYARVFTIQKTTFELQTFVRYWHSHRGLAYWTRPSPLPSLFFAPGAASGRRRSSRGCACHAEDADPCRRALRLRIRYGCVTNGGPIGQIHFGVGYDLLIRCLPRSLRSIRVTRTGWACPGTEQGQNWPSQDGPRPGRIRLIRVTLSGSVSARASGTGRFGPRLGTSESQDSVGRAEAQSAAAGENPPQPARRRGCPGPAGWPQHHRGERRGGAQN